MGLTKSKSEMPDYLPVSKAVLLDQIDWLLKELDRTDSELARRFKYDIMYRVQGEKELMQITQAISMNIRRHSNIA